MLISSALCLGALLSCSQLSVDEQPVTQGDTIDRPVYRSALISHIDDKGKIELQKALAKLSHVNHIQLPNDFFRQQSKIHFTQQIAPSLQHPNGLPVEHTKPITFELVTEGGRCYLRNNNRDALVPLLYTSCKPE